MWTRSKSKAAKEALDFKSLDAPKRKTLIKSKYLNSIESLKSSPKPVPFNLHTKTVVPQMANPVQNLYPTWDNGVPIALAVLHDIPTNVFKTVPEFDATTEKIAYEHCVDVVGLAKIHNIQHEDVMVRLLTQSFKGKVLEWYRGLTDGSVTSWAQLAEPFILEFNEVEDSFSLLTQFTSIKRFEQESILDFNIRFQKSWKRVPVSVRPQQSQDLMYYLRAFPTNLSLQI